MSVCIACGGALETDRKIMAHFAFPDNLGMDIRVLRCGQCRLRRLDPIPSREMYERIYEDAYFSPDTGSDEGLNYERNRPDRLRIYRHKLTRLKTFAPEARTLIDIGAGDGDFLDTCRDQYEIHGLEFSAYGVQKARDNLGIHIRQGAAEDLSQFNQKFDIVHMHHVFEHLPDPAGFLKILKQRLNVSGIFIFEVPHQFEELNFKIRNIFGMPSVLKGLYAVHHPFFYTPASLKIMLERAGFEVMRMTTCPREKQYYLTDSVLKRIPRLALYGVQKLLCRGPVIETVCGRK